MNLLVRYLTVSAEIVKKKTLYFSKYFDRTHTTTIAMNLLGIVYKTLKEILIYF